MRILAAVVALMSAASACADAASRPVTGHGRWFADSAGRVFTPHGVAVMDFKAPHLPEAIGFGDDDAAFLAAHGFEVVRVGFNWEGIEPQPGRFDRDQIASLARTIKVLWRHGIRSILDAHQDGYSTVTGTDGAPAWATQFHGLPNNRIAFGVDYFANPALWRAFDNLYANAPGPDGVGLADHFAAMWAQLAKATRRLPGLMGYELINEPYPGSAWPACVNPLGCPDFDAKLSAFYRRVTTRIRTIDRSHLVFYEPQLFFDFGVDTRLKDPGGGTPGAFSFHFYCLGAGAGDALPELPFSALPCSIEEQLSLANADRYARASGQPQIVTEWAATDDLQITARVASEMDAAMVPWTFWNYNTPRFVTRPGDPLVAPNVNTKALAIIDRPHPRMVAGTPLAWRWDAGRRTFTLQYDTGPPAGVNRKASARTSVWAGRLHFPGGYRAEAEGAVVTSRPNAKLLVLRNVAGARRVSLKVTPAP